MTPAATFALALLATALAYRSAFRSKDLERRAALGFALLRAVAVALAALVAVDPIVTLDERPRDPARIAVLVDTSRSMAIRDSVGGAPRIETAARLLGPEKLLDRLGTLGRVELAGFDMATHPFDLARPEARGDASDLAGAVGRAAAKVDPVPLAAVVLLTDGCETGPKSLADMTPGVPVYPIALGSVEDAFAGEADVAVTDVRCERDLAVRSTAEAVVELRASHLDGERVQVQLKKGDEVLAEAPAALGPGTVSVPLRFVPRETGLFELEAVAVPHPRERLVENNRRSFAVSVASQKVRVLYYEGTPRWEFKFLGRELKKDARLSFEAVLRTSGARAYEQGTGPSNGPASLPASREALRRWDCVVLGDVKSGEVTEQQARALTEWVREDGGGLVVLAGKDSFSPEGLVALGLEPLLPFGLQGIQAASGTFAVSGTRESATHPAFAGISRLLPLESAYVPGPLKPGAQLLASAESPSGRFPLAAAQRYGAGRVFAFASDADWKWVMKDRAEGGEELFIRLWGQAIRWAASHEETKVDAGAPLLATDKKVYRPGETVRLRLRGSTADHLAIDGEGVPLLAAAEGPEGVFTPRRSGLHEARAGAASCAFFVERAAGEFDRIAVFESLLHGVAAATGGECFDATTASRLPDAIRASGRIRFERREHALGESWVVYLLLVGALVAEWILRKRAQVTT